MRGVLRLSRLQKDSHATEFVNAGTVQLSASKKSLKILVDDPDKAFSDVYFVGLGDVQKAINEPKFAARIVKVKEVSE